MGLGSRLRSSGCYSTYLWSPILESAWAALLVSSPGLLIVLGSSAASSAEQLNAQAMALMEVVGTLSSMVGGAGSEHGHVSHGRVKTGRMLSLKNSNHHEEMNF